MASKDYLAFDMIHAGQSGFLVARSLVLIFNPDISSCPRHTVFKPRDNPTTWGNFDKVS